MKPVFLATTAIEDFWDTARPMVFLSEGCLRYGRRLFWEPISAEIMPDDWDVARKISSDKYVDGIYEKLIGPFSEALNDIHGVHRRDRYWRVVTGLWLVLYIAVMYDRYTAITKALKQYPSLTTIALSEGSFITALDTLDFINHVYSDSYNLQIYTRIFSAMGKNFPEKSFTVSPKPVVSSSAENIVKKIVKRFSNTMLTLCDHLFEDESSVILKSSYFPKSMLFRFMLGTAGKIRPSFVEPVHLEPLPLDANARSRFCRISLGDTEFEKMLIELLALDVPRAFIENFSAITDYTEKSYPKNVKAIVTADSWLLDEAFKQWAALSSENGTLLLGAQHGGNYGSILVNPSEKHEIRIADRFYSWGWLHSEYASKVFPMPSPRLACRKQFSADNSKNGILWSSTTESRYLLHFMFPPSHFRGYLAWQARFVKAMDPKLRCLVRARVHKEDMGWEVASRLREVCSDLFLEKFDISFLKSLENCRLYVCDCLTTTFLESLSAGKPTVLFWSPEMVPLRKAAEPYYQLLRGAGILYESPEKAAATINRIYGDVEGWWNSPERQFARREFCDAFGRISSDPVDDWLKEFKGIIRS